MGGTAVGRRRLPAVPAIVPGCVFASYVAAGVEADPNFGDNAYRTDKSRYDRNFRYTGLFPTPPVGEGRTCGSASKG